jgi:CRP-like cAMP-binding protein
MEEEFQIFLAENSEPKQFNPGQCIFKMGDAAENSYYLLKGKLKVTLANGKSGSKGPSSNPFSAGYENYSLSAEAEEKSLVLKINLSPKEQEQFLCWQFAYDYSQKSPWVMSVKNCDMFDHIPAANLLRLIQAFKVKKAEPDELITKENAYERQFYVLISGKAEVFQGKLDENSTPIFEISQLQTFGEASLMDDLPRTASIKMAEEGELMVLDASQLDDLLSVNIPEEKFVNNAQLKEALSKGSKILDIRPEKE